MSLADMKAPWQKIADAFLSQIRSRRGLEVDLLDALGSRAGQQLVVQLLRFLYLVVFDVFDFTKFLILSKLCWCQVFMFKCYSYSIYL